MSPLQRPRKQAAPQAVRPDDPPLLLQLLTQPSSHRRPPRPWGSHPGASSDAAPPQPASAGADSGVSL